MHARILRIVAQDCPPGGLMQLSQLSKPDLTVVVEHECRTSGAMPTAMILCSADRAALTTALAKHFAYYVEWTGPTETADALRRATASLVISLTTRTAYRSFSGRMLGQTLSDRGIIAPSVAPDVGGSVQEAIANAVIHGNLGMRLPPDADDEAFSRFHELIARRLAAPEGERRRVTIAASWTQTELAITVSDEGDGFHLPDAAAEISGTTTSGRGFLIMRRLSKSIAFADEGRSTVLGYARFA